MTDGAIDAYRVKITIRNNLLLSAIEKAGYKSQAEFARAIGYSGTQLNNLVALRDAPIREDGTFSEVAKAVMEALGATPTDLWTEAQLMMKLSGNTRDITMGEARVRAMIEEHGQMMTLPDPAAALEGTEITKVVDAILNTLPPYLVTVLRMRYVDGLTLEQCGEALGVTRERVRQIEMKGLRFMRHPDRQAMLGEYHPDPDRLRRDEASRAEMKAISEAETEANTKRLIAESAAKWWKERVNG